VKAGVGEGRRRKESGREGVIEKTTRGLQGERGGVVMKRGLEERGREVGEWGGGVGMGGDRGTGVEGGIGGGSRARMLDG